jgi:ion channel-forming bestrophin family protein
VIDYDPRGWWRVAFSVQGTVVPHVLGRVGFLTGLCLALVLLDNYVLDRFGYPLPPLDQLGHTILGTSLGLLIVFRTNTAYARFWEARTLWGGIVNASRNLLRLGSAHAAPVDDLARLISAFAVILKQSLRGSRDFTAVRRLLPAFLIEQLAVAPNPPSVVTWAMSDWVRERIDTGNLEPILAAQLESTIATLVDCQGGCERIKNTPVPFTYAALIKFSLLLYLMTLPFVLVAKMGFAAPLVVAGVAFGMLGIEEAGVEIENPFGLEPNNLPLDTICDTIAREADQAMIAEKR